MGDRETGVDCDFFVVVQHGNAAAILKMHLLNPEYINWLYSH